MPSDTSTALALPEPVTRRGLDEFQWRTLKHVLYPGATSEAIYLVVDYCIAHKLDPMRKPVHIVPMEVKVASTDRTEWRDIPIPGIYLWRTIASRTGLYLGHSKPDYGPLIEVKGLKVPEWCAIVGYRLHQATGHRVEFPCAPTYFREVVATTRDGKPNARWSRAPVQMLSKCAEAAMLREVFPDEFGGLHVAEELDGRRLDAIDATGAAVVTESEAPPLQQPAGYDAWLADLIAVADNGLDAFAEAWATAPPECRAYLVATEPGAYESLKDKASATSAPSSSDEAP